MSRAASAWSALVGIFISASVATHAQPPFPVNQRLEVNSIDDREITDFRPTLLFERPAFLDDNFTLAFMPVRVDTGCNNVGLIARVGETGEFGRSLFRYTISYCAGTAEVEGLFLRTMARITRWRMDGEILVLEGENSSLRLAPIEQDHGKSSAIAATKFWPTFVADKYSRAR